MIKVNDVVTAGMPTPLAVRTLTLAPWPRTLYFKVPEREVAKEVEEEEAEAASAVAEPVSGVWEEVLVSNSLHTLVFWSTGKFESFFIFFNGFVSLVFLLFSSSLTQYSAPLAFNHQKG